MEKPAYISAVCHGCGTESPRVFIGDLPSLSFLNDANERISVAFQKAGWLNDQSKPLCPICRAEGAP